MTPFLALLATQIAIGSVKPATVTDRIAYVVERTAYLSLVRADSQTSAVETVRGLLQRGEPVSNWGARQSHSWYASSSPVMPDGTVALPSVTYLKAQYGVAPAGGSPYLLTYEPNLTTLGTGARAYLVWTLSERSFPVPVQASSAAEAVKGAQGWVDALYETPATWDRYQASLSPSGAALGPQASALPWGPFWLSALPFKWSASATMPTAKGADDLVRPPVDSILTDATTKTDAKPP